MSITVLTVGLSLLYSQFITDETARTDMNVRIFTLSPTEGTRQVPLVVLLVVTATHLWVFSCFPVYAVALSSGVNIVITDTNVVTVSSGVFPSPRPLLIDRLFMSGVPFLVAQDTPALCTPCIRVPKLLTVATVHVLLRANTPRILTITAYAFFVQPDEIEATPLYRTVSLLVIQRKLSSTDVLLFRVTGPGCLAEILSQVRLIASTVGRSTLSSFLNEVTLPEGVALG